MLSCSTGLTTSSTSRRIASSLSTEPSATTAWCRRRAASAPNRSWTVSRSRSRSSGLKSSSSSGAPKGHVRASSRRFRSIRRATPGSSSTATSSDTIADQKRAYTLADRSTFLATKSLELYIAFDGSDDLLNNYHVIVVDHEGTNTGCAEEFSSWILDKPAQDAIAEFGVEEFGEQLFTPDAGN